MARVTDRQRAIIHASRAFALWRAPNDADPTLFASAGPPRLGQVFDPATRPTRPSFVMAPFSTDDGNTAWHISADVIDGPGGLSITDGADAMLDGQPGPYFAPDRTAPATGAVPRTAYEDRIARIVADIRAGQAEKVVMSRAEPVDVKGRDLIACFEALAACYPPAFVALVSSDPTGTWLVATPETLLHVDDTEIRTMALAGTQWPEDLTDLSRITWPPKLVTEQGIVAAEIRKTFEALAIAGVTEKAARTVQAANLCHLRSDFSAPRPPETTLGALLARLHPTSAVCGMPRAAARTLITREEGDTRGFYTGYLGPCRHDGATQLFVNLRSARVAGDTAYLHVGGGIVADSVPATEWQETEEKTKTIRRVL